jgi:hypothetical protein
MLEKKSKIFSLSERWRKCKKFVGRLEFPPSKKQKTFRVSELCRIPRYAREQFVEDSRQSINFVF